MKYEIHINVTWEVEADSEEQALEMGKEMVRSDGAAYVKVYPIEED